MKNRRCAQDSGGKAICTVRGSAPGETEYCFGHSVFRTFNGCRARAPTRRPDAYGNPPERRISDGNYVPCRHCLRTVAKGEPYLVLAFRPFRSLQPYAETGPIFLHGEACEHGVSRGDLPDILSSPQYILRGYDADERIVYGTGSVVPTMELLERTGHILADERVAFVHIRSAQNNCFQCRAERG